MLGPHLHSQGNGTTVTSLQRHTATLTQGAVCPQGKQAARTSTAGRHSGLAALVGRLPPCCEDHPCGTCCSRAAACAAQYDLLHALLLDRRSYGGQNPGIHHCICSLLFIGCFSRLTRNQQHLTTHYHTLPHHFTSSPGQVQLVGPKLLFVFASA